MTTIIANITSTTQPAESSKPLSEYEVWRQKVARQLWNSNYQAEAIAFRDCGKDENFRAYAVCKKNPRHFAKPIVHHCHLRYCDYCETRAQAKRMERFVPVIDKALESWRAGSYRLRHIVLTTPYDLSKEEILEQYPKARKAVQKTLERLFYDVRKAYATPEEHRRKRISLKRHGIGVIVGDEFGEVGKKLHFHVLAFCPFVPHAKITEYWRHYTDNEAYISDIKQVHDKNTALRETVTKYVIKLTEMPPHLIPCLQKVLAGRRRIRSYGIWYNIEVEEEEPCRCPECNHIVGYMKRLDYELTYGKKVLTNFSSNTGNKSGEKIVSMAQFIDGKPPPDPPPIPKPQLLTGFDDENLIPKRKDSTYSQ